MKIIYLDRYLENNMIFYEIFLKFAVKKIIEFEKIGF